MAAASTAGVSSPARRDALECGTPRRTTHCNHRGSEAQYRCQKAVRSARDSVAMSQFASAQQAIFFFSLFFFFCIPQGSKASQPLKAPCRPGFSQNFYTVIVSRDKLHGQSILKGESSHCFCCCFCCCWRFIYRVIFLLLFAQNWPPPAF